MSNFHLENGKRFVDDFRKNYPPSENLATSWIIEETYNWCMEGFQRTAKIRIRGSTATKSIKFESGRPVDYTHHVGWTKAVEEII